MNWNFDSTAQIVLDVLFATLQESYSCLLGRVFSPFCEVSCWRECKHAEGEFLETHSVGHLLDEMTAIAGMVSLCLS